MSVKQAYEVNFDGLVGLTHNYAGLSFGNVASTSNKNAVANPKVAALQGLQKMKKGGKYQLVIPPDLAYGSTPRPGIPANSALIFEVELLDIKKPAKK